MSNEYIQLKKSTLSPTKHSRPTLHAITTQLSNMSHSLSKCFQKPLIIMSLKLATYNVHGWYDDDGQHNLERVVDLYREHPALKYNLQSCAMLTVN